MNVSSCRSRHTGELKVLADLISDLMPRAAGLTAPSKFVHVRTQSVLPPRPVPSTNTRKIDHYGCRESSRDLAMLFIPKMAGVNVWQERLSESDLRKLLRDSGWLENRTYNRFLLPIIKELEILAPKLVIIISQRHVQTRQDRLCKWRMLPAINTDIMHQSRNKVGELEVPIDVLLFAGIPSMMPLNAQTSPFWS